MHTYIYMYPRETAAGAVAVTRLCVYPRISPVSLILPCCVCACAGEEQKQVQYVLAARKFATKVKRADLVAVIEAFAGEKRWRI